MNTVRIIKGLLTFVPGLYDLLKKDSPGGTGIAKYCYKVWMVHLTCLWENGMREIPKTVAEIGPGGTIGTGLCALLSGANRYYAVDTAKWAPVDRNLAILEELVDLFQKRALIPSGKPPYEENHAGTPFPSHILTDEILRETLAEDRIEMIRNAIKGEGSAGSIAINYVAPWDDETIIPKESVDHLFSQSTLEHIQDLENVFRAFTVWMKPGGYCSHQIDLSAHQYADKWNGHWVYPKWKWFIIKGKRAYGINRLPCSWYQESFRRIGLEILFELKLPGENGISRNQLSTDWRHISDEDFNCGHLTTLARKSPTPSSGEKTNAYSEPSRVRKKHARDSRAAPF